MKDYVSGLLFVVVTVVLLLTGVWYYFFSRVVETTQQPAHTMSSDAIRVHIVNDLAAKLSFIISKREAEVSFPTEWQQLGTASSECEITTAHCQIALSDCYNFEKNIGGKFTMPVDSSKGSADRSGFAIKQEAHHLLIKACYAETTSPISQKINLP